MRLEYWSSRKKSHWFSSHFWSSFCFPWLSPSLAACHTLLTRSHSRVNTSLVTQRLSPLLYFLFTAANKKIRYLSKLRNSKRHSGHWSGCGHVAYCSKTLSFADIFWLNVPDFSLWTLTLCWSSAILAVIQICDCSPPILMLQNLLHYKHYIFHHNEWISRRGTEICRIVKLCNNMEHWDVHDRYLSLCMHFNILKQLKNLILTLALHSFNIIQNGVDNIIPVFLWYRHFWVRRPPEVLCTCHASSSLSLRSSLGPCPVWAHVNIAAAGG